MRPAATNTGPGAAQQNAKSTRSSATSCQPPIRPSQWKNLRQYGNWIKAGFQGVIRMGKWSSSGYYKFRFGFVWGGAQHWKDGTYLSAVWKEGLTQGQWKLFLQPTPWIHTAQFLPMCLWHLQNHCPFTRAQGEFLCMSESLCRPFKRNPR